MMNPPTGIARTLATLLSEVEKVPARDAIRLVRSLALQVAELHSTGRIHRGICATAVALNADSAPALIPAEIVGLAEAPADARQYLPQELGQLQPAELPEDISDAKRELVKAGISLDPRQIDIYALGALWCRLLTGETPAAYLRSPRVKRDVPTAVRPTLERALGSDGRDRFADAAEFMRNLDLTLEVSSESIPDAVSDLAPPAKPSGDTTPSYVKSPDTATWIAVNVAAERAKNEIPFAKLGHYEIVGRIGHGGMGDVYQGYESGLDRHVAIKVLPPELGRQVDFVRRFKAEATAAAKLIHPNIIQIYYIGEDAGHHFFAMQYVAGESLAELLARKGRLGVDETLAIIEQALAGLAAAHKQGLVHRDIKPANILLDREHRRALLADFGLVKSVETSGIGHTATGVIMGTVDYISPEQGRGQPVDGRSDLYSLGVLLYHMLSGRLPFVADSPTALIFQHVYEQPQPLGQAVSDIPPALAAIVAKLMRKNAADRYQTVDGLLTDLRAFRSGRTLPSGADRLPQQDSAARPSRPSMVFAPAESSGNEPDLPAIGPLMPPNWWERARGRAQSLFWRHAPEAIQQLQNTQQQVDGAVARYARQERELRKLVDEAEAVLSDLQAQIQEQQTAAEHARQRAAEVSNATDAHAAQFAEISAKQLAAGLEKRAVEQLDQLGAIKLKLAQVVTKRRELENQRDILNARLKLAGVRMAVDAGRTPRTQTIFPPVAGIAILALLAGIVTVWRFNSLNKQSTDTGGVTNSNLGSSLESIAQSPSTAKSLAPERELKEQAPLELRALPLTRIPLSDKTEKRRSVAYHPQTSELWILTDNQILSFPTGSSEAVKSQPLRVNVPMSSMTLSSDGTLLAGSIESQEQAEGGRISIIRSDSGRLQKSSAKLFQSVKSVMFSPDDTTVAAIHLDESNRGHLRLWPTESLDKPGTIANDQIDIQCMAFDPRGKWLAAGAADGALHIYDPTSGGPRHHELKAHAGSITALAAGLDGCTLVSGGTDGKLFLWDAKSGQKLGEFEAHGKQIEALAISPDGVHLASSDSGSTLAWDMSIGAVRWVFDTTGPTQLAFDRTGKTLATLERTSGRVATWNPIVNVAPHTGRIRGSGIQLSTQSISTPPVYIDRTHFAYAADSIAYVYDTLLNANTPRFVGHSNPIRSLTLSEDRATLVSGGDDGSIRFWAASSGETTATLTIPANQRDASVSVRHLAVSENGRLTVAATAHELFVIEPEGATKIRRLDCPLEQVTALAWYSAAEPLILIGGRDPETSRSGVVIWNLSQSVVHARVGSSTAPVDWLSPDTFGSRFVWAAGGTIRVCSIDSGSILREWTVPNGENAAFAVSPDRRRLGVGIGTHIGIWNLDTGLEFLHLSRDTSFGPPAAIRSISFAADDVLIGLDEKSSFFTQSLEPGHFQEMNFTSLFNDVLKELNGPWAEIAMSRAGRTSMLQSFQLDQNPLIKFTGPAGDADLRNFATDGGWWINKGALVRQPSARHLAVDFGVAGHFVLEITTVPSKRSRLFFLLGWDRYGGYCLAQEPLDGKRVWRLISLADGTSQSVSVTDDSDFDRFDETTFTFRASGTKLQFSIGSVNVNNAEITLSEYRTGRLVMGVIDGQSNSPPVKILRTTISKF